MRPNASHCSSKSIIFREHAPPIFLCFILASLFLAGCSTLFPEPTSTPTNTPSPTSTSQPTTTSTATVTSTPTFTPTPTETPTPAPLSPSAIFDLVSPSIAFIDTPIGTGSGVLIEDGYIVTNAHVVWPYATVRVAMSDGQEFLDTPVLNWDLLGDLAIVGPIDTDVKPIKFVNGEDLIIGSEVYLIGYPNEVDKFPKPTITRGLISRLREWESIGVTYFQTDATISGGQSGGVLVSEMGDVIAITGFSLGEFGLGASASDILSRIEGLLAGEDVDNLGERRVPTEGGEKEYSFITLENEWDTSLYVVNVPVGTNLEISAEGERDIAFIVYDAYGQVFIYEDQVARGEEVGSGRTELEAPYFVEVYQFSPLSQFISINANQRLIPYIDLDDNKGLSSPRTLVGNLDYPGDVDVFRLVLDEGESINIQVDSILINPSIVIARPGDREDQIVFDDDTGEGIFGLNAELTFTAPDPGTYLLIVRDSSSQSIGGYTIEVDKPYPGAPTPMAPALPPRPTNTSVGPMYKYETVLGSYTMQYPSFLTNDAAAIDEWGELCDAVTECFVSDTIALVIAEEELAPLNVYTLEGYVEIILEATLANPAVTFEGNEEFITEEGETASVITLSIQDGLFLIKRFISVHDGHAFSATYVYFSDLDEFMEPIIEYSFGSFETN